MSNKGLISKIYSSNNSISKKIIILKAQLKMGRRPKQTFLKEHQMANRHMKRCSTLLSIREMQIKTTIRYHLPWSERPSSKSLQIINAGEGVEEREPSCTVGGNVNWCSHYGEQYGGSLKN